MTVTRLAKNQIDYIRERAVKFGYTCDPVPYLDEIEKLWADVGRFKADLDHQITATETAEREADGYRRALASIEVAVSSALEDMHRPDTVLGSVEKVIRQRDGLGRRCAVRFEETEKLRAALAEVRTGKSRVGDGINRREWTHQQWLDEARGSFYGAFGSAGDLLNGHVSAMWAALAEAERERDTARAVAKSNKRHVEAMAQEVERLNALVVRNHDNCAAEQTAIHEREEWEALQAGLAEAKRERAAVLSILDDMIPAEPDPCTFDHHGYCQAHGWLSDGECPHARAKRFLAPPSSLDTAAHDYVSTACQHDRHTDCRRQCKFCAGLCRCACHLKSSPDTAAGTETSQSSGHQDTAVEPLQRLVDELWRDFSGSSTEFLSAMETAYNLGKVSGDMTWQDRAVIDAAKVRAQVIRDLRQFGSGTEGWTDRDRESDWALLAAVDALVALDVPAAATAAGDGKNPSFPHEPAATPADEKAAPPETNCWYCESPMWQDKFGGWRHTRGAKDHRAGTEPEDGWAAAVSASDADGPVQLQPDGTYEPQPAPVRTMCPCDLPLGHEGECYL